LGTSPAPLAQFRKVRAVSAAFSLTREITDDIELG